MKKLLTVLLLTMLCVAAVFAEDTIPNAKEVFRVELVGSAALNSNLYSTGLPHAEATAKIAFFNDKVGLLGGVECNNDFLLDDENTVLRSFNYLCGVELFHNTFAMGLHSNDGELGLGSLHYRHNWKLMEKKLGHFLYGVDLFAGLSMIPAIKQNDPKSLIFVLIPIPFLPRVTFGGSVRVGGAI